MAYTSTPLYGGAIVVDLPQGFIDASNLRQIPDNQEVWLDQDGFSSIVVEILERVNAPSDEEAFRAHAIDLIGEEDSSQPLIDASDVRRIEATQKNEPQQWTTFTLDTAAPPGKNELERRKVLAEQAGAAEIDRSEVKLFLGLIRLPEQETDVLVSVNVPGLSADEPHAGRAMLEARDRLLNSFQIKDWALFG